MQNHGRILNTNIWTEKLICIDKQNHIDFSAGIKEIWKFFL